MKTFYVCKDDLIVNRILAEEPLSIEGHVLVDAAEYNNVFNIGDTLDKTASESLQLERQRELKSREISSKAQLELNAEFEKICPGYWSANVEENLTRLSREISHAVDGQVSFIGLHCNLVKQMPLDDANKALSAILARRLSIANKQSKLKEQIAKATKLAAISKIMWCFLLCFFLACPTYSQSTSTGYYVRHGLVNFPPNPVANSTVCLDSTTGYLYVWNGSAWQYINNGTFTKNNYSATTNPTASNDNTQGYSVGSVWFNTTTPAFYICSSADTGAAVWTLLNGNALNNYTATNPPGVNDDISEGYSVGSLWFNNGGLETYTCWGNALGNAYWLQTSGANFNHYWYLLTGNIIQNAVDASVIQPVPVASNTITYPSGNFYINGQTFPFFGQTVTYSSATSWTYDFAEAGGSINSIPEPYSSGIPVDPDGGVAFQYVVTDGSDNITSIVPLSPTVSPVLPNLLQAIPNTSGLVLQTDTTNPNKLSYGQVALGSINTTGLSANPLLFDGTNIISGQVALNQLNLSGLSTNPMKFNGTAITTGQITPSEIDSSSASGHQLLGYNGSSNQFFNGNVGVSVSTTTTINLTAGSPGLQSLDPTGGSITVNLPQASTCPGQIFYVANTATTGVNTVTVVLYAGDATVGTVTLVIPNSTVIGLESDGTINWIALP